MECSRPLRPLHRCGWQSSHTSCLCPLKRSNDRAIFVLSQSCEVFYRLAANHSFVSVHNFLLASGIAPLPLFTPSYMASHSSNAVFRSPAKSIDWGK